MRSIATIYFRGSPVGVIAFDEINTHELGVYMVSVLTEFFLEGVSVATVPNWGGVSWMVHAAPFLGIDRRETGRAFVA